MELSSGNLGIVLVSKAVAKLIGKDLGQVSKQRADFAVFGDVRTTIDGTFPDQIMEGSLGMPFLRD